MDVVKFFETLAKIIETKENVNIKVNINRKECDSNDQTNETPKGSVSNY